MAEGVCSSSAHGGFEVSSLVDSCSEISESDSVSEASLSLRMEVEPYLFEPEHSLGESNIVGEIEDSVEMDLFVLRGLVTITGVFINDDKPSNLLSVKIF